MIDWKKSGDGDEAELSQDGFRARLWAWPIGYEGRYRARAIVEKDSGGRYDRSADAKSQEEARQKAADLLRAYLDGDPEEQAFRAKLRAWVAPVAQGIEP